MSRFRLFALFVRVTLTRLLPLSLLLFAILWVVFPFAEEDLERYPSSRTLLDRNGVPLRLLLSPEGNWCEPVSLQKTGEWAAPALIAAEDKRFRKHVGLDMLAVLRAVRDNIGSGRSVSGASTLSTQVIRMTKPRPRTIRTKLIEAFRALQMERVLSKTAILEQYLNRAPFGSNLVGIQAASRHYFDKDAGDLNLAEASLLMGLPQSPSRFRPDRHLDRALNRRAYVLERMTAEGYANEARVQQAAVLDLNHVRRHAHPFRAPHFCDLVLQERQDHLSRLDHGVLTTLDTKVQDMAEAELARHAENMRVQGVYGGAVVIVEVATGAVRALMGSPDFRDREHAGQFNAAYATRSPGSTLKPFAFALALDRGLCTPDSVLGDVPMHFRDYDPKNFSLSYRGLVTVRESLVQSLNIPALKMTQQVGLQRFVGFLQALGLSTVDRAPEHYGLSVVLGTAEVTLLELSNAYAALARGGRWMPYRLLANDPVPETRRVCSAEAAYLVADMLGGDERALEMSGHAAEVRMPRFAWKTGTSMGLRDAWTIAYNPDYVVGVWLGNPDGVGSEALVGTQVAAPLAGRIFRRLYPDGAAPWFAQPERVQSRRICAVSGSAAGQHCREIAEGFYIEARSSTEPCRVHVTRPGTSVMAESWPPDIERYLRDRGFTRAVAETATRAKPGLKILSPSEGDTYYQVSARPDGTQAIPLRARSTTSQRVFWFVDDRLVGSSESGTPWSWPLRKGTHRITCSDDQGQGDRVTIRVL